MNCHKESSSCANSWLRLVLLSFNFYQFPLKFGCVKISTHTVIPSDNKYQKHVKMPSWERVEEVSWMQGCRICLYYYCWFHYNLSLSCFGERSFSYFYAPAIKWLGHIVLPLSVIPSFRLSVLPDSVSAHYLSHTWRFLNEIWYISLSRGCAGWVRIWVRSNNFRQSYDPLT